jgi:predicted Zn-ribbon and HTH transcriptional regulator
MKKRPLKPFVPIERRETIRQKIVLLLESRRSPGLSAKDISVEAGVSEREVYEHLEHIKRTTNNSSHSFVVTPAACKKCGFVFRKRDKLNKPGRCPVCRNESIQEPLFYIENK